MTTTTEKLVEMVEEMQEELEAERQAREELEETVEKQAEQIEWLEEEVETQASNIGGAHNRISELKEELESRGAPSSDSKPPVQDDETGPQTPMERIAGYNQVQAFRHLTSNQERAWFLAKDIDRHAKDAPAGYILDTKTIKDVIAGHEDKELHDNNARRIKAFMDRLGGDTTRVKKKNGKDLLIIDKEAGKRMMEHHRRCKAMDESPTPGTVIPA